MFRLRAAHLHQANGFHTITWGEALQTLALISSEQRLEHLPGCPGDKWPRLNPSEFSHLADTNNLARTAWQSCSMGSRHKW